MAVVCHNLKGRWGKHKREAWLYAKVDRDTTRGLKHHPLVWFREVYLRRFGIEASYRQVHQAKIKSSSRNPILRLLFAGVVLIFRNVRLNRILLWLVVEIAQYYRLLRGLTVYHDLDKTAYEFGIIFNY